jgi:hypothetical protein
MTTEEKMKMQHLLKSFAFEIIALHIETTRKIELDAQYDTQKILKKFLEQIENC